MWDRNAENPCHISAETLALKGNEIRASDLEQYEASWCAVQKHVGRYGLQQHMAIANYLFPKSFAARPISPALSH